MCRSVGGGIRMAPRRFLLLRHRVSSGYSVLHPSPSHSHALTARSWWSHFILQATEPAGQRNCSLSFTVQEPVKSETKWHELPPVPKQVRSWTAWELNTLKRNSDGKASGYGCENHGIDEGLQNITALRWVTKCCPSLPNSLLHKLFRMRQVRKQTLLPSSSEIQHQERPSVTLDIEHLETRMRRVSVKAVLEEGTVLYLPKSVFQSKAQALLEQHSKKTQHQPTTEEVTWLQSLVLYKGAEMLVINKPPGLPVQGGSEIKRSLDSLMGAALSFDYDDGPRLVHRLDKETSGIMVLARTQECALLLHALFRKKTATTSQTDDAKTTIDRIYWALVIGTPKQSQGRISAPLIKVVLDGGRVDKIRVSHDILSENAQVAITDYKVIGPAYHGCTWVELHPLTGRKHQLRVHCAEVLGTPVLGDIKYGWRTQREWLTNMESQNSETFPFKGATDNILGKGLEDMKNMKIVKGSVLAKVPLLHLHCRQMTLPNVKQMLEQHRSKKNSKNMIDILKFVAPLPVHMAASRDLWAQNSFKASE